MGNLLLATSKHLTPLFEFKNARKSWKPESEKSTFHKLVSHSQWYKGCKLYFCFYHLLCGVRGFTWILSEGMFRGRAVLRDFWAIQPRVTGNLFSG